MLCLGRDSITNSHFVFSMGSFRHFLLCSPFMFHFTWNFSMFHWTIAGLKHIKCSLSNQMHIKHSFQIIRMEDMFSLHFCSLKDMYSRSNYLLGYIQHCSQCNYFNFLSIRYKLNYKCIESKLWFIFIPEFTLHCWN